MQIGAEYDEKKKLWVRPIPLFGPNTEGFFKGSSKWRIYQTVGNGECAFDTLAIALNLEQGSNQEIWTNLRGGLKDLKNNESVSKDRMIIDSKLTRSKDVAVDDLSFMFLEVFYRIPIIINTRHDSDIIPFIYVPPPFAEWDKLLKNDQFGKYVLICYSGEKGYRGHYRPYGAMCKKIEGQEKRFVKTVFTEDRLPFGLLAAWRAGYEEFKQKHAEKLQKDRIARKHKHETVFNPKKTDVIEID